MIKMIESRYSIEYIDPSSERKSSKLGRFFIYSALTISILAAITALMFSNLPNGTPQVITDKVQQLISSFNKPSTDSFVEEEIITPEPETPIVTIENTQVNDKSELTEQRLIATQREDKYKKEIDLLNQKNTSQQNESVKHLTKIKALTKKLEVLSKQYKNEVQKNTLIKKDMVSLQTENKSVSSLLKKAQKTAEKYANEINKTKQKERNIVAQPIIIGPAISEPVEIKKVEPEAVIVETKKVIKDTTKANKSEAPKSQMDAIVAAMEAANNTSNDTTAKK